MTVVHPDCPAPAPVLVEATSYDISRGLIMTDEDFELLIGQKARSPSAGSAAVPTPSTTTSADVVAHPDRQADDRDHDEDRRGRRSRTKPKATAGWCSARFWRRRFAASP
ncbi:MAG: hypothetical protein MZW92_02610 [Comamonadaceae bacterium]|nr:hypothetical protein [Comamonadaceae bacterium]